MSSGGVVEFLTSDLYWDELFQMEVNIQKAGEKAPLFQDPFPESAKRQDQADVFNSARAWLP